MFHGRIERALWNTSKLLAETREVDGIKDALYHHPRKGYIWYRASNWQQDHKERYRYLHKSEAMDCFISFHEEDRLVTSI